MRKFGLFLGTAGLLLFISVAWVEGQGGDKKQKGGGGGFGGFFGGGPSDAYTLFNRADVKKELEITEDQTAKLPAEVMVAIGKILDEKQFKRFKQIDMQKKGLAAFKDKAVQKQLKMSGEQVKSVESLVDDSAKEIAELQPKFGGGGKGGGGKGGGDFKGALEKIETARKEAKEKILTVLSKEQRATYRELVGEEFKFQQGGFGGFGGGGKKKDEPKKDTE